MQKQIKVAGVRIDYREEGKGRPLILVHGLGASQHLWDRNVDELARRFRVITPDLPGCGRSGKPFFFDYSLIHLGQILEKFVLSFAPEKVALVGNSLGGGLALLAATQIPQHLSHLIVMGSVCYPQPIPPGFAIGRIPVVGELAMLFFGKWAVRFVLRESVVDQSLVTRERVNLFSRPVYSPFWRAAQLKTVRGIIPKDVTVMTDAYKQIRVPTLILWGKEDGITPAYLAERLNQNIPGSQLRLIPGCGHIPQFEKPDVVNRLILDFLKR